MRKRKQVFKRPVLSPELKLSQETKQRKKHASRDGLLLNIHPTHSSLHVSSSRNPIRNPSHAPAQFYHYNYTLGLPPNISDMDKGLTAMPQRLNFPPGEEFSQSDLKTRVKESLDYRIEQPGNRIKRKGSVAKVFSSSF